MNPKPPQEPSVEEVIRRIDEVLDEFRETTAERLEREKRENAIYDDLPLF